jgi:hypothetical protein
VDVNTSDVIIDDAIGRTLKSLLHEQEWQWLSAQTQIVAADPQPGTVARVFTSLPKQLKSVNNQAYVSLDKAYLGHNQLPLLVQDWSVVRLARVWVLMAIPQLVNADYLQLIERLFKYGEMEELIALYSALPVYHYPETWKSRCEEGIRSNIGLVRHAVMVHNAYPSRFLDEAAWNQLVLKAFFTDEDIPNIVGLAGRNNRRLAQALTDYAYERYAAKREINPMLWILVGPFIDERAYDLMARIMEESRTLLERKAIAYAFKRSSFDRTRVYVKGNEELVALSDRNRTPWQAWEQ